MLSDFQKFGSDRFISKFAMKLLLNIPPLLEVVAALPCKRQDWPENLPRIDRNWFCHSYVTMQMFLWVVPKYA